MLQATKTYKPEVKVIVIRGKNGSFETPPEFPSHATYFHPVLKKYQSALKSGLHLIGHFGRTHDTGKKDKRGKRIYYSIFIPSKIMN